MAVQITRVLEELREDHRNIALLLNLLEMEADRINAGDEPDYELMHDIMQYMTVYSDAVHHPKEDLVYDAMRAHGDELAEGLEGVQPDHREIAVLGTTLRGDIEAIISGTAVTRERIIADMVDYITRLRKHMAWEEEDLFLKADELAKQNADICIDAAHLDDGDPVFGAVKASSFSNLLAHLQNAVRRG